MSINCTHFDVHNLIGLQLPNTLLIYNTNTCTIINSLSHHALYVFICVLCIYKASTKSIYYIKTGYGVYGQ